ncbi:MFS transporter [Noviherbaspirillum denitrificans]|uniref:MFS transporter n=1 Tax=Noviherbaspirillum denitrificans TaxID=1968433 RepID=A0A254TG63_9BURK|nr:MFS transporter [Noviherbaspirillum denitrificans]OWW21515.1 MFS transporter [Noviherbaspirillum denitrificans]
MNSTPHKQERLILLCLAGIQFTHILDFMIMMPLGPQLIRVLHINTHEFGLLLSSYTFTAAASGLLAATYVDRFDRRKLLLALYVLFIVATLCCGLAPNYATLLLARALAGAFGGILGAMVQTMIADVVPFERRGQAMGTVMAAFSASTVAGVPLGLYLAEHLPRLGWRAPFFFIVLVSCLILYLGYRYLPPLTAHLGRGRPGNVFQRIYAVAREPEHLKAFFFIALLMMNFSVIPYIALYYTTTVGMTDSFITLVYLVGGGATLLTSRVIGKLADRHGKLPVFRWIAVLSFVPILVTTHLVPVPWWLVLINSTVFFILVPGRMIPGMAMVSAVAPVQVRGTFMSLGSSVQMLASGTASLVAGLIITRNAAGQIEHFNVVGYLAVGCGLVALWMAGRLKTPVAAPGEQDRPRG